MEPTDSDDATEMRSLELDALEDVTHDVEFPVTTAELIERFGDYVVEYPRGRESLASILQTSGMQTCRSPTDVQHTILNGVRRDAVGRPRYSDRNDSRFHDFDRPQQSF